MRVLGRTDQLAAIDDFLDGLSESAPLSVLLLIGAIGIGKTTLWSEAIVRARRLGYCILTARPVEPEAPLGFAALSDLLVDLPPALIGELAPPQRRALRVALLREDVGDDPPDPRSVATATLNVLRSLAAQQPVLLAVDDLIWLDAESARVLAFVLRRLGSERIGLIASVRDDPDADRPDLPTDGVDASRLRALTLGSLSPGAIRELLRERLEFAASRRDLLRLHDASDGNPFFALELARSLDPGADLDGGVPVPPTLRRLIQGRVTDLDPQVRTVLLAASLAPGAPESVIVSAVGGYARAQLVQAEADGIVTLHDGQVSFTHPLLRSVVAADAAPEQRRNTHRRLADAVASPVERARHLALAAAAPDEQVAGALDDAARESQLQGAIETAAELGELAIAMSPHDNAQRVVAAAAYRFDSGDAARARVLLRDVVDQAEPGTERAALLVRLATYERYCGEPLPVWQATLTAALAEAEAEAGVGENVDVDVQITCHHDLGFAAFNSGAFEQGARHIAAIAALVDRVTDRSLAAQVNASLAWAGFAAGRGVATHLAERAMQLYRAGDPVPAEVRPPYTLAMMYFHVGDLDRARQLLDAECAAVRDRGDEAALVVLIWLLVIVETWAGNWARADELVHEGEQAAEFSGMQAGRALIGGARTMLRSGQGRVDEARAERERVVSLSTQLGLIVPITFAGEGLAQLELSLGDAEAAYRVLVPALDTFRVTGIGEPGMARGLPDAVEALIRLGRLDAAEELLAPFAARSAEVDRSWAVVTTGRCTGLLLAARGELEAAVAAVESAVDRAATLGLPLELGRTLLIAGEIHRRARHKRLAHDRLSAAQGCFDALGATLWSARCTAELERTASGRAGTTATTLTETEQRVADLAAEGRTTREIAGALFTSARTVEAHLQRVYRKLGVHSRVELSRRLPR